MLTWLLTLHDAPDCLLLHFLVNVHLVHSMVTIIALQLRFLGIQFIEDLFNMSWAHFEPKPIGILTTYIIFPLDHLKGQQKSNLLCTSYCSLNLDSCSRHTSICGCLHYIYTANYPLSSFLSHRKWSFLFPFAISTDSFLVFRTVFDDGGSWSLYNFRQLAVWTTSWPYEDCWKW